MLGSRARLRYLPRAQFRGSASPGEKKLAFDNFFDNLLHPFSRRGWSQCLGYETDGGHGRFKLGEVHVGANPGFNFGFGQLFWQESFQEGELKSILTLFCRNSQGLENLDCFGIWKGFAIALAIKFGLDHAGKVAGSSIPTLGGFDDLPFDRIINLDLRGAEDPR